MPRKLLKQMVPPLAWEALRQMKAAVRPPTTGWFLCPEGPKAFARPGHWKTDDVARIYERRWKSFQEVLTNPAPPVFASELDSPSFDPKTSFNADQLMRHNTILGLLFAVSRASRQRPKISMLDFGSGVGHQYGLIRALLPDLKVDCTCFDLPVSAEFGAKHFPAVKFSSTFACLEQKYDLVIANNSLQYFEHWGTVLEQVANAARDFCFVTMAPVLLEGPSKVMIQRFTFPDGSTYAEPEWFFSRDELLSKFPSSSWKLQRELLCGYSPLVHDTRLRAEYRGFLFERK